MAGKTGLVTHTELKVLEENQWLDCSVRSSGWGKHSLLYILPQEHCEKSLQKRKCMNLIMNSSAQMTHMHITCKILIVVLIFVEHNYNNIAVDYNWFKRYLMFGHTWLPSPFPRTPPPLPHFTYTQSYTHTHLPVPVLLPNSQAMKCTSHLRSKGISPKSFLWIIEEDQASLTLIILQSICLASPPITSNASDDRFSQSEESVQLEMQSVLFCIVYTDTAWRV